MRKKIHACPSIKKSTERHPLHITQSVALSDHCRPLQLALLLEPACRARDMQKAAQDVFSAPNAITKHDKMERLAYCVVPVPRATIFFQSELSKRSSECFGSPSCCPRVSSSLVFF